MQGRQAAGRSRGGRIGGDAGFGGPLGQELAAVPDEGAEVSVDTLVGLNKRHSAGGVCSAQQRHLMGFQTTAEGKSRELPSQASWGGCKAGC